MSNPPPPPPGGQPPYGQQPAYVAPPPPPRRKRPRAVWFLIGGALIVLAPVVFVGALFTVLRPLTQEDATFSAGDSPVSVELPAGEERALFSSDGSDVDCSAVDGTGAEIDFRPVSGEFTFNEWTAVARFDTGDGDLTFTCEGSYPDSEIRVAQLPSTGGFVAGIVVGVIVPLIMGLLGLVMLIVTTILYATGAPRKEPGAA